MGHVRDLPRKRFGVDIENNFKPIYQIIPGQKRTINALKAAAKKCQNLYLATDMDREGEAIAWHLAQILGVPEEKVYRVIFNAITRSAIKQAFGKPGRIDMNKVMAQQARRILDRIVGYQISPLLWKKVARGLSAGRVQSIAVKMIVERERQIRDFKPQEYWLIPAIFTTELKSDYHQAWLDFITKEEDGKTPTKAKENQWLAQHNAFKAQLIRIGDEKFQAKTRDEALRIFNAIKDAQFKLSDMHTKQSIWKPPPPFITSTLQADAANRLGFSTKKTMTIAQQLYEGIDLGSMGRLGLITYMRTDSTHLSPEAINQARQYIDRHIGKDYLPEKPCIYAARRFAQAAHEAIRPTDVDLTSSDIKSFLSPDQFKLYDLIWRRFLACQMQPAKWNITNLNIVADTSLGKCWYKATGRILLFDGFTKIWPITSNEQQLPPLTPGQPLAAIDIKPEQHFTKPPARYTEASLVKALEKEGIGRPSTYAPIISTIQERGYVEQRNKKFYATELGEIVTDKLNQYFPRIMDIAFTRYMESQLDKIEEQQLDWVDVLRQFYTPFKENLDTAITQMKHAREEVKQKQSEHKCPTCGQPMVYRWGRFGPFLGCSNWPDCKTTLKLDNQQTSDSSNLSTQNSPVITQIKCYKCQDGQLVVRHSRRGSFLGCSNYPACRTIIPIEQLENLQRLQSEGKWPPPTAEEAKALLGRKKSTNP